MPAKEGLAQVLAEAHVTHEAFGLPRHISRRGDHDDALGVPTLSLGQSHRSSPQGMPDCQSGTAVTTPNRMNRVDEVRKGAQLARAATVSWLIERDYGQTCLT
jgi:hypothetical protein